MYLSIIIPVYNEEKKIATDLREAGVFLQKHHLSGEIIVSNDGSTDGTAQVVSEIIKESDNNIRMIGSGFNRGKGYAVKQGVMHSKGRIVMFIDSGNCVPFDSILPALKMIENDETEIAHASRFLKDSKILALRPFHRRLWSWLFRKFIRHYAKLPSNITDSQCGLSIYRGDVARGLYSGLQSDGFLFDVEIILKAQRQGFRITEFPIHWTPDPDSRLKPLPLLGRIGPELRLIRKALGE